MYERKFKLRMIIPNFPELDVLMSEEHFGVLWSLRMRKFDVADQNMIGVYLYCQRVEDIRQPWSIDTTFSFTFPSVRKSELPVRTGSHKFTQSEGTGWKTIHPCKKLLEADVGDTLIFECSVTINEMTGIAPKRRDSEERKKPTEIALNTANRLHEVSKKVRMTGLEPMRGNYIESVKSTKITLEMGESSFNISRKFLATNFTYFHGMLFSGFSESKEEKLKLDDVDPKLFHRILEFIDTPIILPEDDLVGILELSVYLGAGNVARQFEKAIVEDDRIAKKDKFRLADTYNLPLLKNQCLNNISDLNSLRAHSPKYIFDLNHSTLAHIMHKIIHGFGVPAGSKNQTDAPVQEVEKKFKMQFVVPKFSKLDCHYSKREKHLGEQWELGIKKQKDGKFGYFLYCKREKDDKNPWEIHVNYKFTFPCINGTHVLDDQRSATFDKATGWGATKKVDWFMPAVVDDVLVVECKVKIIKMTGIPRTKTVTFDEPMESGSAITLGVGDQKFHLSKTFLSFHSTYFKSLYSKERANQPDVYLKGLNAEDFQLLLEVLHNQQVLDDENLIGVLKLAALLGVPKVLEQCEKLVVGSGKVTMKQKLRLADEHNLQQLMCHCLNNTNTFSDLNAYMPIIVFDLQKHTLAMFLNKVINHF